MITQLISRLAILTFGVLYPAYSSYKAVREKNVRDYVKWMMYWIVFAIFLCVETFTDVLLGFWFPFYYEIKVALVFWLQSPTTRGSSFLYRKFVHPALLRRESDIDEMIANSKRNGYMTLLGLGSKGLEVATKAIAQTVGKPAVTNKEDDLATSVCFPERLVIDPQSDEDVPLDSHTFDDIDNFDDDSEQTADIELPVNCHSARARHQNR